MLGTILIGIIVVIVLAYGVSFVVSGFYEYKASSDGAEWVFNLALGVALLLVAITGLITIF